MEQNAKEPREDANKGDLEDDRVQTNAERMELNYVQNPENVGLKRCSVVLRRCDQGEDEAEQEAKRRRRTICQVMLRRCESEKPSQHLVREDPAVFSRREEPPVATNGEDVGASGIGSQRPPLFRHFKKCVVPSSVVPRDKATFAVGDLCLFQCRNCLRKFTQHRALMMRALHSKECSVKGEKKKNGAIESLVEARYHICSVCAARVLCDKGLINRHISRMHRITLDDDYMPLVNRRLREEQEGREIKLFGQELEGNQEERQRKLVPIVPPFSTVEVHSKALKDDKVTDFIGNICSFACTECSFTSNSLTALCTHAKKCMGDGDFQPTTVTEARYHRCGICTTILLCDVSVIQAHARKVHGFGIREYSTMADNKRKSEYQTQCEKREEAQKQTVARKSPFSPTQESSTPLDNPWFKSCPKCSYQSGSTPAFHLHMRKTHKLSPEKYKLLRTGCISLEDVVNDLKYPKPLNPINKFPTIEPKGELTWVESSSMVPKECLSREMGNLCKYKCDQCDMETTMWSTLRRHVTQTHGFPALGYEKKFVKEARYHPCKLCSQAVLCDRYFIRNHILHHHKGYNVAAYKNHRGEGFEVNN